MQRRVLEIIGSFAIALVLVGMTSSYLLVKILMTTLPGFGDSVYREASKGPYNMSSLIRITIFALILIVTVYAVLWSAHYFLRRMSFLKRMRFSEVVHKGSQFAGHHVLFNVLALIFLLASLVLNMWVTAIHTVTLNSLSAIEVLAPEIPEATRLRLRVDFFSMRNADDFHLFERKLRVLSRARNVTLPDFDLL